MKFKNLIFNRKKIATLTTIVSLSMMLTGCGGDSNSEKNSQNKVVVSSTTYAKDNSYNAGYSDSSYIEELEQENESLRDEISRLHENDGESIENIDDEYMNTEDVANESTTEVETFSMSDLYLGVVTDVNNDEEELYIFKQVSSTNIYSEYNDSFEAYYGFHNYGEECDNDFCVRYAHIFAGDLQPLYLCLTEEQQKNVLDNKNQITGAFLNDLLNDLRSAYHSKENKKLVK